MFAAAVLALFAYSVCKNEIQCSTIRGESFIAQGLKNSTKLQEGLTLLKKIEDFVVQNESRVSPRIRNEKRIVPSKAADISATPLLAEAGNPVEIANRENLQPEAKPGRRQPKFFGSLGFLAGLSAAGLANAASDNVNVFANILNGPVPLSFGTSGYFAGFYKPQPFFPFSYPVLYPVQSFANNFPNFVNGIPMIPPPISLKNANATDEKSLSKKDNDSTVNDEADARLKNEKPQENGEAAATQEVLKKTIAPVVDDENIDALPLNEDTELRKFRQAETGTSTTSTTSNPLETTTKPVPTNTTESSNVTVPKNNTESFQFNGYYGGNPQDVSHVILTTEEPQQRFVMDETPEMFQVPFERAGVLFNPYESAESYSSPFVNSFSPREEYPEFLNTIDSDRYLYDIQNRRNLNGFRPILK